jgi:hypothetical protein
MPVDSFPADGQQARAHKLWWEIDGRTRYLLDEGYPAAALTRPEQELLEQAAQGGAIDEEKLAPVLERAQKLATHLTWESLKHFPRD